MLIPNLECWNSGSCLLKSSIRLDWRSVLQYKRFMALLLRRSCWNALWDIQISKEQAQDMVVALKGWEVPDALEPKADTLVAQQINLVNSLRAKGKFLSVAIQCNVDLA